jgi:D-alanyl-D-alanine carboxypeptidase
MTSARFISPILVFMLLFLAVLISSSHAHLSIVTQGPASGGDVPERGDLYGSSLAVGDFDGDGFEDLAAGAPDDGQDVVQSFEGALTINYGSVHGLTHERSQYVTIGDISDDDARFASALAAGDFDGDGFDDLAVGVPELDYLGTTGAGAVFVYRGSSTGLIPSAPEVYTLADLGLTPGAFENWGVTLTTGDFDGNGRDDLAAAAPNRVPGGLVTVIFGTPGGLDPSIAYTVSANDLGSFNSTGQRFGEALAAGHVRGGGEDDLVIGSPGESVDGVYENGRIYVIPGSAGGMDPSDFVFYDALSPGFAPSLSGAEELGSSLAVGRFHSDGRDRASIVAGAPGRVDVSNPAEVDEGMVRILLFPDGATAPEWDYKYRPSFEPFANQGDRFGERVAVGDFNADGEDDLLVSAPGVDDDSGPSTVSNTGRIFLAYSLVTYANVEIWDPLDLNDRDLEIGSRIGQALATGLFDDTGLANLAIGAPRKDYDVWVEDQGPNVQDAGQVYIVAPWRQVQRMETRSAIALDCEDEVIFSLHPFKRVEMASVAKTMAGLLGCEAIDGGLDPLTPHTAADWYENRDNLPCNCWSFVEGQRTTFLDLLRVMMGKSSNDAAYAVADVLTGPLQWSGRANTVADFADAMNARAQELGMFDTLYSNPAGYGTPHYVFGDRPYSTAWDQAILARVANENECLAEIAITKNWTINTFYPAGSFLQIDTLVPRSLSNSFIRGFDDWHPDALGIKGGLTDAARRTAMYAVRNSPLDGIGVVVGAGFGFDTATDRYREGAKLMNLALGECTSPGGVILPGGPSPDLPVDVFTGIPACQGQTSVISTDITSAPYDPVTLQIRTWDSPSAQFNIFMTRRVLTSMEWTATLNLDLDRFQRSEGWTVTNVGDEPTVLRIQVDTPPVNTQVSLQPGASYVVLAANAPGESATRLTVESLYEPGVSTVQIEMIQHILPFLSLGDPSQVEEVRFSRSGTADVLLDELDIRLDGTTVGCAESTDTQVSLSFNEGNPTSPTSVDIPVPGNSGSMVRLLASVPNPFNPVTKIRYELQRPSSVRLAVHDLAGRRVRTLVDGYTKAAGLHHQTWDGRDNAGAMVASGVYLIRIEANGHFDTQRIALLK